MNHGRPVVPFSDWLTQRSVTGPSEVVRNSIIISLFYSGCLFMNLKRCLWAINCLRIYCHLQPPKTTFRNLRKVNRSTKGYHSVWRRQHGGRKAMGNIWSLIWLSPTKHFFSGSTEPENVTSRNILDI